MIEIRHPHGPLDPEETRISGRRIRPTCNTHRRRATTMSHTPGGTP